MKNKIKVIKTKRVSAKQIDLSFELYGHSNGVVTPYKTRRETLVAMGKEM